MADAVLDHLAPQSLHLAEGDVHLWLVGLDQFKGSLDLLRASLTPDEQNRASRFHFQKDRDHFVACRGVLRRLLGAYLKLATEAIQFRYNDYGKPFLEPACKPIPLEFNLSHSHGLALYGFNLTRTIGVDVEQIRPNIETEELAERFFAPTEVAALKALPEELRIKAFFNGWSRKEAFIKARGLGLSLPLDEFAVSITDACPALLSVKKDPDAAARWTIRNVSTPAGFVGAIALEGPIRHLQEHQFL